MTANSSRNPNPSLGVCYYPVLRVESLPEFAPIVVRWNSALYEGHGWLEHVRTNLPPFIRLPNGQGVAYVHGKVRYLAILPDQTLLDGIVEELARAEHLKVDVLPRDIRSRDRGGLRYFFNYGPETITLQFPPETKFRLGGPELPVAGLTVVEREN